MNLEEIQTNVNECIKIITNDPDMSVSSESLLIDDLGLESIDLIDLTSEIENAIGIEVDLKEVAQVQGEAASLNSMKVGDIVNFIANTQVQ